MIDHTATRRLEGALARAAADHARSLRSAESAARAAFEQRFLLSRLSLPATLLAGDGTATPALRALALDRLRAEGNRLARRARAAGPGYDLNRHIAVRRLLVLLEPAAPTTSEPEGKPGSGRMLNARFRARRMGRGRPARYSTKTRELAAAPVASITEMSTKPGSSGFQEA